MVAMFSVKRILPGLVFLVAGAAAVAAPDPDALAAVREWQRETLESLADRAAEAGHAVLVRRAALALRRAGLEPRERPEAAEAPDLPARRREKLDAELAAYRAEAARKLALAGAAEEALRLDPGNERAHEALGHVRVKGWGFVDAADRERLEKGLLPTPDGWVTEERAREPGVFARVISPHFELRSRLPLPRTFELRDLLEDFHALWTGDWEGVLPPAAEERRHVVYVFDGKDAYEAFVTATDPQAIRGVPGQYSPNLRRAVFFDVETLRSDTNRTSSMTELMLHECAHQLFYEDVAGDFRALDGDAAPNAWLHEGIAEFYGMHTRKRGELVFDARAVGKTVRTPWLAERLERAPSLTELDGMKKGEFLSPDGEQRVVNYAFSGFLSAFLATEGYAPDLRAMVRALYAEGNPPGLLSAKGPEDLGRLDRKFRSWFRRLR